MSRTEEISRLLAPEDYLVDGGFKNADIEWAHGNDIRQKPHEWRKGAGVGQAYASYATPWPTVKQRNSRGRRPRG